jgi:hypothetical protein
MDGGDDPGDAANCGQGGYNFLLFAHGNDLARNERAVSK